MDPAQTLGFKHTGWAAFQAEGGIRQVLQGTRIQDPSYSQPQDHTHPAQARHGQRDAGLEVIRILFAQTGDEADSSCDHSLQWQVEGTSESWGWSDWARTQAWTWREGRGSGEGQGQAGVCTGVTVGLRSEMRRLHGLGNCASRPGCPGCSWHLGKKPWELWIGWARAQGLCCPGK
jgi:hypothetical protein